MVTIVDELAGELDRREDESVLREEDVAAREGNVTAGEDRLVDAIANTDKKASEATTGRPESGGGDRFPSQLDSDDMDWLRPDAGTPLPRDDLHEALQTIQLQWE